MTANPIKLAPSFRKSSSKMAITSTQKYESVGLRELNKEYLIGLDDFEPKVSSMI